MKKTKLKAQLRTVKGSAAAGRLRRQGMFPAVIYGKDRASMDIQLNAHEFVMLLRSHKSENMILDMEVDGSTPIKILVKAIQHHPVTGRVIHADFYEVSMTRRIEISAQIVLTGVAVGVSQQGGMLEHVLREISLECLPGDVPEEVLLEVSNLHIGDLLRVKDIQLDSAKYTILDDPEVVVVAVAAARTAAQEEAEAEAEATVAAKGPEVIKEKKEEASEEKEKEKKK
jgi:large subunit ribosomal protein L25